MIVGISWYWNNFVYGRSVTPFQNREVQLRIEYGGSRAPIADISQASFWINESKIDLDSLPEADRRSLNVLNASNEFPDHLANLPPSLVRHRKALTISAHSNIVRISIADEPAQFSWDHSFNIRDGAIILNPRGKEGRLDSVDYGQTNEPDPHSHCGNQEAGWPW